MNQNQRHLARAAATMALEHPSLIIWYLQNRLRSGVVLPLEQRFGNGRSLPPRFVTLKPTLRCNLRCEFCRFVANGDVFGKKDWLELEEWMGLVDQIAPLRPYVCITGGEPTLFPGLPQLIARIRHHGLTCVLTTNGTLLEKHAAALVEADLDLVILSLDGPREVHDRVRMVDGTFEKAVRGAAALRTAAAARKGRPRLIINTTLTGHTWESARQMVEIARELGALALNLQHFWFMTPQMVDRHNETWGDCFPLDFDRIGGTFTEGIDADRLADLIDQLKRTDNGLPLTFFPDLDRESLRTYYADPETFTHRFTPACAWLSTDILPNGDVSPCFELVGGNLREQSFQEIWNSPPLVAHRQRLSHHGPYPICARCCAYFRVD